MRQIDHKVTEMSIYVQNKINDSVTDKSQQNGSKGLDVAQISPG